MAKFFSAAALSFYDDAIHTSLPADAVPISDARHAELLAGQRAGKTIGGDANGNPRLVNRPTPPIAARRAAAVAAIKREAERRILAIATIWRQLNDIADISRCSAAGLAEPADAWARRAAIDATRDASNRIEARVADMSAAELAAFDPADDSLWKGTSND